MPPRMLDPSREQETSIRSKMHHVLGTRVRRAAWHRSYRTNNAGIDTKLRAERKASAHRHDRGEEPLVFRVHAVSHDPDTG